MPPPPPRPPRDIRPADFFEGWLPARYAEYVAERRVDSLEVRVQLLGEGGGAWDLRVGGPTLAVRERGSGERLVTITQTVEDWRALACGEDGGFDLLPPRAGPLDFLFVDPALRGVVQVARGTARFEVPGYNGRTWWAEVKLGEQPRPDAPDATISMDAETYHAVLTQRLAPPEAFFSGRVHLLGDQTLAMQIALALLPRFSA